MSVTETKPRARAEKAVRQAERERELAVQRAAVLEAELAKLRAERSQE